MLIACIIGATLVTSFRPGDLSPEAAQQLIGQAETAYAQSTESAGMKRQIDQIVERLVEMDPNNRDLIAPARDKSLGGAWMNILRQLIPRNIFNEMALGNTLGVIVFALLFGLALAAGQRFQ